MISLKHILIFLSSWWFLEKIITLDVKLCSCMYEEYPDHDLDMTPPDSLDREEDFHDDIPYYNEWNEKMADFHPKSLLSVLISPKSSEVFYETVVKQPTTIKGMFFTTSKDDYLSVQVVVRSPINQVLYTNDSPEGLFSVDANMVGDYQISLTNTHWMTPVAVTFATGTDDHSILKTEHVENTFNRIKKLEEHIDNIYSQFRYFWTHNNRQMNATKKAQGRLLLYALLQFTVILVCSLISIWYVKKTVSNKRIL
ncbi:P24 family protein, putative [Theileria annulata]|uniref:P24 family protein, putative n=1 Tax=Theileria annulata TaxID=5874 RepID=Q4UGR1_THEAN|nr:P24 family protein, putative [Theileria annulata]CAI73728.1 P24 family protein, putative [Theileria annulata]|eukprot:XP_954405.1 P24 family protein, putative [Theileria annulata]